jgi:hypothetical protein
MSIIWAMRSRRPDDGHGVGLRNPGSYKSLDTAVRPKSFIESYYSYGYTQLEAVFIRTESQCQVPKWPSNKIPFIALSANSCCN